VVALTNVPGISSSSLPPFRLPTHVQPLVTLADQCAKASEAFFCGQWSGNNEKKAGCALDGRTQDAVKTVIGMALFVRPLPAQASHERGLFGDASRHHWEALGAAGDHFTFGTSLESKEARATVARAQRLAVEHAGFLTGWAIAAVCAHGRAATALARLAARAGAAAEARAGAAAEARAGAAAGACVPSRALGLSVGVILAALASSQAEA
jgi:hypothetical protein